MIMMEKRFWGTVYQQSDVGLIFSSNLCQRLLVNRKHLLIQEQNLSQRKTSVLASLNVCDFIMTTTSLKNLYEDKFLCFRI